MVEPSRTYNDLPEAVFDFLNDASGVEAIGLIVQHHKGKPSDKAKLLYLSDQIALGGVALDALPGELARIFGLDEQAARGATIEFVAARVLPIAGPLGIDAVGFLRSLGAEPAVYQNVESIKAEPVASQTVSVGGIRTRGDMAAALSGNSIPKFSDPVLQHRLELIEASYRDGVRTREQAVKVLMRPIKTGGLEMSEEEAGQVLDLVPPKSAKTEPVAAEPAVELPKAAEQPKIQTVEGGAKADAFLQEDEEEVRKAAESKKEAMEHPTLITDTKAAADRIVADAKLSFATGELRTRFDHIIDARLRDVRDGFETRARLEAPADQGGLGLAGAQLVAVMEAVEAMDATHHRALAAEMAKKKDELRAKKEESAKGAEATAQKEAQVMAKRYAEITGRAPTELVAPTPSRPTASPKQETVARRERQIDTDKVRAAIEAAKVPSPSVRPVLSEASVPSAPSGRPKVEDVRFERKLAGPVEELRLLTLADFRRLSKDPRQATRKIQDKVELVSQEGYDRRIAAIKAWRESPISRLYVSLSRDALLAGKGIFQVLAEKRAAGEDVPTDEELRAVVELNGSLRF